MRCDFVVVAASTVVLPDGFVSSVVVDVVVGVVVGVVVVVVVVVVGVVVTAVALTLFASSISEVGRSDRSTICGISGGKVVCSPIMVKYALLGMQPLSKASLTERVLSDGMK